MISAKKVKKLAANVMKAADESPQLKSCKKDIKDLISMLYDYARGEYRHISKSTAFIAGICIAYIMCPIDITPDFIPVIGQMDDAAVICFLLKVLKSEIGFYRIWLAVKNSKK